MAIFFTSDIHFNHTNVLAYCSRPFSSIEEMNEAIIERWNKLIKSKDEVYIIGDFALKTGGSEIAKRLNGSKYLIAGNHDESFIEEYEREKTFVWIKHYHELKYNKIKFVLCHYSMRVWNKSHYGSIMLHGHSHGNLPPKGKSFDVGMDCWNYTPISIDDAIEVANGLEVMMDKNDPNEDSVMHHVSKTVWNGRDFLNNIRKQQ